MLKKNLKLLLISLPLFALACGDDDGGTATNAPDASASPDGDSAGPTSSAREDTGDIETEGACALLSDREAEVIVGTLSADHEDGELDGAASCTWAGESGELTVTLLEAASEDAAAAALDELVDEGDEPLSDTDLGYYTSDSSIAGRRGVYVYQVLVETDETSVKEKLIDISRRVLLRIPAEEGGS